MTARFRPVTLLAAALLLTISLPSTAFATPSDTGDGEPTTSEQIKEVVNNAIIGHAENGFYLDFKPIGVVELPRILLAKTEAGGWTLDFYGSTKSALKSDTYGMMPHGEGDGHGDLIQTPSDEAFAEKEHLHAAMVRTSGHVVVDFSLSRHLIFGLLSMALVFGVFVSLAGRYREGEGRTEAPRGILQNMMEVLVVFIRDEVAKPNIGEEKYKKFLPYLLTAFFFILVSNILGLVPFAGAATSNIAVTATLAFVTFAIGLLYGSKHHYEHLLLGPPDAPVGIRIILVPIEILGLITRHAALAIRLFANMMGGSLIIFSLIGLVFIMTIVSDSTAVGIGTGIISTGFTVFILLLKLLVAFIQAYVFTILSALFIGMSVEEGHHDEEHAAGETAHAPA